MQSLISALQFLTVLPLGRNTEFQPNKIVRYFPVVGLILGLLLALFDYVTSLLWSRSIVAVLDVVFLIIITGAFHLDGLGDTADGLFGIRSKEKALEIMKDSRVGAMGVVAVICVFAMKWAGITNLDLHRYEVLIMVPALSRAAQIFGIALLPYGRPMGGTAHGLFSRNLKSTEFVFVVIPIVSALFLGYLGLLLILGFGLITLGTIYFYKHRLACITGDMLGAMTEVTESALFLIAAVSLH